MSKLIELSIGCHFWHFVVSTCVIHCYRAQSNIDIIGRQAEASLRGGIRGEGRVVVLGCKVEGQGGGGGGLEGGVKVSHLL